jgi:glycogen debranching enzyme
MTDKGFYVSIRLDEETGLLSGGSPSNCGTWMDKMGESQLAGNSGVPSTPRDGAPVEITGLLKSTLRWLTALSTGNNDSLFSFKGVICRSHRFLSYEEWNQRLQASFERLYFIPGPSVFEGTGTGPGAHYFSVDPRYVHRLVNHLSFFFTSSFLPHLLLLLPVLMDLILLLS